MSYRVCNGYLSLPSRYSPCGIHQYNVDTGRRSPRWVSKDLGSIQHEMESPRPFALSELERHIEAAGHYSRGIESPRQLDRSRSVSPLRGIHSLEHSSKFPFGTDYAKNLPSPPLSRQHSLSRLPAASLDESGLELSLGHRGWSRSSLDLRASLTESAQSRAGLVQCLKEAKEKLEGQSEELRKRDKELERSKAKIDMLALKQKQLEGSISELEKEKGWLEVSRYEDKKQRGELQDRIVNLEIEVMRAKSNLENLNYTNMFTNQKNATYSNTVTASAVPKENDGMVQELRTARENLLFFRNRVKGLEAEKNRALEELRTLREGSQLALSQTNEANQRATDTIQAQQNMQEELTDLQIKYNSVNLEKELLSSKVMRLEEKVSDLGVRLKIAQTDKERFLQEKLDLHRRTQELSLELERAQRGREGFNDQVSDLHIELVGAKAQANRQDQEKVQMKEELVLLKQVNDRLTLELGQTQQKLQSCMDELHQIQAEHKISTNLASALEAERAQLLAEKQLLQTAVLNDEESDSIRELRSSREQLQEERDALRTRCNTLEVALEQAHEQMGNQIQEQQQVTLYWKERWQQTALNLKNAEEKLEQTSQKAADKSTELLQECEMLQAGTEELSELRATVNSLKEENNQLKKTIKKQEQQIQSDIQTTMDDNTEEVNYPQNELSAQLQRTYDRVKVLEREQSEKDIEIRKLKAESGAVLRIELDVCKQQLDLERSHRAALQDRVGELESRLRAEEQGAEVLENNVDTQRSRSFNQRSTSDEARSQIVNLQQELEKEKEVRAQKDHIILLLREELEELKHKKPGEIKASLEEVDSELILVREELQKVWDMLKIKDTELEEQYQELKSARGQYTECSNENLRLEQLVVSLQKQLTESEQTVKRLKHMREVEKTELDIERSSLELKLAEAREQAEEASSQTGLKRPKEVQAAEGSHLKCARCDVFLLQLDKAIKGCQGRNVELQEEKSQVLASLHQLQEILKDVSKQTKMNENVAQTLQVDNETLKKQHNLVTEQLKNLFKEKQNLGKAYNKLPKEEIPKEEWAVKSKLVKNVLSAIKDNERHQEELGGQIDQLQENEAQKKEMRSLERQLDEKSDQISSMASEIKTLREKNESLMKAKLRFQQQVQQIRSISQPHHEKELTDPSVPRLSADPVDAHQSIKAEFILSGSQESLAASAESQASFQCPSEGSLTASPQNSRPGTPLNPKVHGSPLRPIFPGTAMKSWKRSSEVYLLSPRSQADSEATNDTQGSLTPRASALLSPRPYRPQKTIQTFKFRDIQEQSIN